MGWRYYSPYRRRASGGLVTVAIFIFILGYAFSSRPAASPVPPASEVPAQVAAPLNTWDNAPAAEMPQKGAAELAPRAQSSEVVQQETPAEVVDPHAQHVAEMTRTIELRKEHAAAIEARRHPVQPAAQPSTGGGASSAGGGSVHVRSYTRKDGTVVRAHTRSR